MRRRTVATAIALVALLSGACEPPSVADTKADTNDGADSTASLQAQLDALKPGQTLKLEPRVYSHSGLLKVRVPGVVIDGGGAATWHATNDETSAVEVLADGVTMTNLTLTAGTGGKRWMGEEQHKLVVKGNGDTISHVTVFGSAGAGVYLSGAQNFTVSDVRITATRADGLHMTGGSANGHVDGVSTDQTGDDGVAVVSYDHDPAPCHDITESNLTVGSTRWGRGITVVGAQNVAIGNFSVAKTSSAGVYVASEGNPFFTRSVDHVSVSNGSITGANYDPDIEQGSILVYTGNPGRHVSDVTISNVKVSATVPTADRNVAIVDETKGGAAAVNGIALTGIQLSDTTIAPFYTNVPAPAYTVANWMLNGTPVAPESN